MNFRLSILVVGLLLLTRPATADTGLSFALDLSFAPTLDSSGPPDDACHPNPYTLSRRGCPSDLNLAVKRPDGPRLSTLDQLFLLAHRLKDLNLDTEVRPNAQLKFTFGLLNLYEQEAKARLELKIEF